MEDPPPPAEGAVTEELEDRPAWEEGDPLHASAPLAYVAERLCEALDLRFGQHVLDIGTGTGNAALAVARRGARAVGLDPSPLPLAHALARARAEGVRVRWVRGRAEALPFREHAFDAVLSTFGAIFAHDPEMAAEEMIRVAKPGGTVGLAGWTAEGLLGRIYVAARLEGDESVADPLVWGTRDQVAQWFGRSAGAMTTAQRSVKLRGPSPEKFAGYLATTLGPVVRAMQALDPEGQASLRGDLEEICRSSNRSGDATFLGAAQYLEVLVRLR